MNSPRSLEACRQLGINPKSLYYIKYKTYLQDNPEIIPLDEEKKKKRFENINAYREEMIEAVKQKREEIIKEQEKAETALTNTENSNNNNSQKKNKKLDVLNLEKMLGDMKKREERNIEKIKQKQKNEIFSEIERNIKIKMIQKIKMIKKYMKEKQKRMTIIKMKEKKMILKKNKKYK